MTAELEGSITQSFDNYQITPEIEMKARPEGDFNSVGVSALAFDKSVYLWYFAGHEVAVEN
jgi:hypothetical protein